MEGVASTLCENGDQASLDASQERLEAALQGRDAPAAVAELRALVRCGDGGRLAAAARAFDGASLGVALNAALADFLAEAWSSEAAGKLWCERMIAEGHLGQARRVLDRLIGSAGSPDKGVRGAAKAFLAQLAAAKKQRSLKAFIRRHGSWLFPDDQTWGMAGYALCLARCHREAATWLASWRLRPDLEPWMVLNLAVSLRELDELGAAGEVGRAALKLPPDHTTYQHRILMAADAGLVGDFGPLEQLGPGRTGLASHYRYLLAMLVALKAGLSGSDRRAAFAQAVPLLAAAARVLPAGISGRPSLGRFRRRAIWALACHRARLGPLSLFWFLSGMRASRPVPT